VFVSLLSVCPDFVLTNELRTALHNDRPSHLGRPPVYKQLHAEPSSIPQFRVESCLTYGTVELLHTRAEALM